MSNLEESKQNAERKARYNPMQGRVVGLRAIQRGIRAREEKIENIQRAIKREQQALAVAQGELRQKREDYDVKEAELIALLAVPETEPEYTLQPAPDNNLVAYLTDGATGWYEPTSIGSERVKAAAYLVRPGGDITLYLDLDGKVSASPVLGDVDEQGPFVPLGGAPEWVVSQ